MRVFGIEEVKGLSKKADYERLIEEFGAKPITPDLVSRFKLDHKFIELKLVFAHRDFDHYLELAGKGEVSIVSGRGPSNYMHLGHLIVFDFIRWLQEKTNAITYIPLSDDEKYVFGKVKKLKDGWFYAIDNALDILSLGFKPGKTYLFISTRMQKIYEYAVTLSRYLTYNAVKATFGLNDSCNAGVIFYAAVQAAHILYPTLERNLPVLVPIAMDQDPYMRLTRDIAERIKVVKPASIYLKYIVGLTGEPMSASKPETCIFTSDTSDIVKKKVWNTLTGGRPTVKEQRKLGGEPDRCVVYQWLTVFFYNVKEAKEHKQKCLAGELLCGECKKILIEKLNRYLATLRQKKKKMLDKVEKYFLHEVGDLIELYLAKIENRKHNC